MPIKVIMLVATLGFTASDPTIDDVLAARYTCGVHLGIPVFDGAVEAFLDDARGVYLVRAIDEGRDEFVDRLEVMETLSGDRISEVRLIARVSAVARLEDREILDLHASDQFYENNAFGAQDFDNYQIHDEACVWVPVVREGRVYLYVSSDVLYQKSVQPIPDTQNDAWLSFVRQHFD
tara:strand:- start:3732 stop:4265 length:534 start_codon:yes stop_codon:yes gene_type:complete